MAAVGTIVESLASAARELPGMPALIAPEGTLSFHELDALSTVCAAGLAALGLRPGDRVALLVRPGKEMVVLAFGLIKLGAVPVLLDPGIGRKHLGRCLEEASPAAFAGIPLADWARLVFGWGRRSVRWSVVVGRPGVPGSIPFHRIITAGRRARLELPVPDPDGPAAIVFTSGSTGPPKGVVYTHRMFAAQAELLRTSFDIQPGEIDLATFPLFALFDPALRMTTVLPRMDFTRPGRVDPLAILGPLRRYGVTHMFGSPALLDRVGHYGEDGGTRLPQVRRVLSAGAPVSDGTLQRFAALLDPGAAIHTPYGATEALPVCSITHFERARLGGPAEGRGTCIGAPLAGVRLEIIPIQDGPIPCWEPTLSLPAGEVGELTVWGENVSPRYWMRPEADELAKIRDPDGRVGHRMGDLGYRDEAGRIWFCGRKSQRVQTPAGTLFTVQCEGIFNAHPAVRRSALVGVGTPPRQRPVLCVELKPGRQGRDSIRDDLLCLARVRPWTQGIETILFHPDFPVDIRHNAKIFREQLAVWAERRMR